jgi:hypothetical protein
MLSPRCEFTQRSGFVVLRETAKEVGKILYARIHPEIAPLVGGVRFNWRENGESKGVGVDLALQVDRVFQVLA